MTSVAIFHFPGLSHTNCSQKQGRKKYKTYRFTSSTSLPTICLLSPRQNPRFRYACRPRRGVAFSPPANPMTDFSNQAFSLQAPLNTNTWTSFPLALIASWIQGWLTSGCAAESFLLLSGPAEHWSVSRYTLLAALNAAHLLASTSWLFHPAFAAICWPLVVVTCIVQYATVSSFARKRFRSWLKYMHFYRDKIAFFYLPSLVIDTDLDGLVTIRGITFSILDLTIELHGIEVG